MKRILAILALLACFSCVGQKEDPGYVYPNDPGDGSAQIVFG